MDVEADEKIPTNSTRKSYMGSKKTQIGAVYAWVIILANIGLAIGVIGLGIAKLVMGILYKNDCPLQPMLPVYLIVDFCVGVALFICVMACAGPCNSDKNSSRNTCVVRLLTCLVLLMLAYLFAWFVAGTKWVIDLREEIYAPGHCQNTTVGTTAANTTASSTIGTTAAVKGGESSCPSCSQALVDFAFGVVVAQWSLLGLAFVAAICIAILGGFILCLCKTLN